MNGRFFLDTNVFVYSFDKSAPTKARLAGQLIRRAVATGKGIVSYQVVQEFFNVALRRFAQPMAAPEAEQYLAVVFRPLLAINSSQALYADGLRLSASMSLSWYDSLIVAAALQGQCTTIYSEDFRHEQQIGKLRILNPFL